MKEIIKRIEGDKLLLSVSSNFFDKDAILNASYKFTNKCFINLESTETQFEVYFQSIENNVDLETIALDFGNELIDQQVRINVGNEFKVIREEIVKKAFSTVNKKI